MKYKYIFQFGTALIFLIAVWLLLKKCGNTGGQKITVKTDTVYQHRVDTINVPYETLVPYKVVYTKDKVLHDTLETFVAGAYTMPADTARIIAQYFATRNYSKTEEVAYGNLTINDTVSQNRITGRSIILTQDIPLIKETVTVEAKKRAVLYFGINAIGNKENIPFASGVTLDLKLRNDIMIGGGAYFTNQETGMIGVNLRFPVRLRKR